MGYRKGLGPPLTWPTLNQAPATQHLSQCALGPSVTTFSQWGNRPDMGTRLWCCGQEWRRRIWRPWVLTRRALLCPPTFGTRPAGADSGLLEQSGRHGRSPCPGPDIATAPQQPLSLGSHADPQHIQRRKKHKGEHEPPSASTPTAKPEKPGRTSVGLQTAPCRPRNLGSSPGGPPRAGWSLS